MSQSPDPNPTPSALSEPVLELIALGAAVAASCPEAFQVHHYRLHKLGVQKEDMVKAVNIALRVKSAPHQAILEMAEAYLVGGQNPDDPGCCGGSCECDEEACGCDEGGCGCH